MFPPLSVIDAGAAIGYTVCTMKPIAKDRRGGVSREKECVSPTCGDLSVTNGTLTVMPAASWANASNVTASGAPRKLACFGDTGTGQLAVLGDGIGMTIIFK